jgi:hypothetical protein
MAVLLTAGACALPVPPHSVLLHPLPPSEEGYSLTRGGLVFRDDTWSLSVHPVDWRSAGDFVLVEDGEHGRKLDNSRHLFLGVVIGNRSPEPITFDPALTSAAGSTGEHLRAAGFSAVTPVAASANEPQGVSPVRIFARPRPVLLSPGTTWRCTLVFEVPQNGPRTVILTVPAARSARPEKRLRFVMEAFPGPSVDRQ